jgi:hypothetical protein
MRSFSLHWEWTLATMPVGELHSSQPGANCGAGGLAPIPAESETAPERTLAMAGLPDRRLRLQPDKRVRHRFLPLAVSQARQCWRTGWCCPIRSGDPCGVRPGQLVYQVVGRPTRRPS